MNTVPDAFEQKLAVALEQLENGVSPEDVLSGFAEDELEEAEEILCIKDFLESQSFGVNPRTSSLKSVLDAVVMTDDSVGESLAPASGILKAIERFFFQKKVWVPALSAFFLGAFVVHPMTNYSSEEEIALLEESIRLQEEINVEYQQFLQDYQEYEQLNKSIFRRVT